MDNGNSNFRGESLYMSAVQEPLPIAVRSECIVAHTSSTSSSSIMYMHEYFSNQIIQWKFDLNLELFSTAVRTATSPVCVLRSWIAQWPFFRNKVKWLFWMLWSSNLYLIWKKTRNNYLKMSWTGSQSAFFFQNIKWNIMRIL